MKRAPILSTVVVVLVMAGFAEAQDVVTCKGSITSKQGEGLVSRSFRFEVAEVAGTDIKDVLDRCRNIAQQRQNKAARANPGVPFRKFSDVELECAQGTRKFEVRRSLRTGP